MACPIQPHFPRRFSRRAWTCESRIRSSRGLERWLDLPPMRRRLSAADAVASCAEVHTPQAPQPSLTQSSEKESPVKDPWPKAASMGQSFSPELVPANMPMPCQTPEAAHTDESQLKGQWKREGRERGRTRPTPRFPRTAYQATGIGTSRKRFQPVWRAIGGQVRKYPENAKRVTAGSEVEGDRASDLTCR